MTRTSTTTTALLRLALARTSTTTLLWLAPPRLAPLLLHYYGSHLHGSHWLALARTSTACTSTTTLLRLAPTTPGLTEEDTAAGATPTSQQQTGWQRILVLLLEELHHWLLGDKCQPEPLGDN